MRELMTPTTVVESRGWSSNKEAIQSDLAKLFVKYGYDKKFGQSSSIIAEHVYRTLMVLLILLCDVKEGKVND